MTEQLSSDDGSAATTPEGRTGRAVALVQPRPTTRPDERPSAEFLAQLIACERRLPAYRKARNAEPGAATSAYRALPGRPSTGLDRST
ncbi:MAG: hypothetical protein JWR08_873 [Enterovirga sp.]|jgi:hypothetical protein|nr:hypothetical protein [Enterovirga sp.]